MRVVRWIIASIILAGVGLLLYIRLRPEKPTFYFPLSVKKSSFNTPIAQAQVEDRIIPVLLDLGSSAYASIDQDIIQAISQKSLLKKSWKADFRGERHDHDVYKIDRLRLVPPLQGEALLFTNLPVDERPTAHQRSRIAVDGKPIDAQLQQGSLGWKLFENTVLFLDLGKEQLILCDTIETLQKHGVSLQKFCRVPLSLERALVECDAISSNGPIRLTLDTGSTLNFFHRENSHDESIETMIHDKIVVPSLRLGNQEFGPITFHPLPILLPIPIKAVLGMEFFDHHQVIIDFKNRHLFFQKILSQ